MTSFVKSVGKIEGYFRNQVETNLFPRFYSFLFLRGGSNCAGIETHLTQQEKMFLHRIARSLSSNSVVVEIGSYLGASACFLAEGAKNNGSHIYCVDTWQNEGMSEGQRDTYRTFLDNVQPFQNVTPLRGTSETVSVNFDKAIDVLFIDADHSYEGVTTDLRCWLPKLKTNGWLLMHDWSWAEGVQRAINELVVPIQASLPRPLPNLYAVQVNSSLLP